MMAAAGFERYQPDRIESADLSLVLAAASETAEALAAGREAIEVVIEPGDATSYRLVISKPHQFVVAGDPTYPAYRTVGDGELLVSMMSPSQLSYVWGPGNSDWTDWTYVLGKWTESEWTARVLAAFLNMLRDELASTAGVTL